MLTTRSDIIAAALAPLLTSFRPVRRSRIDAALAAAGHNPVTNAELDALLWRVTAPPVTAFTTP